MFSYVVLDDFMMLVIHHQNSLLDLFLFVTVTHDQFPHITQIAAVEVESGMTFDTYVIPKIPISPEAQQLTGISCDNQHTCMFVNNSQVASSNITNALKSFCKWLKKFQNVIIVAHNGREFDFPILLSAADNTGMLDRLTSRVTWCLDSLELFRKVYPRRRSHKQKDLVTDLLGQRYDAHDALADSRSLCDLFKLVSVPVERYMDLVFPIEEAQ